MKNSIYLAVLLFLAAAAAFGQVHQDHPEYCGTPGVAVPVPPDISVLANLGRTHWTNVYPWQ